MCGQMTKYARHGEEEKRLLPSCNGIRAFIIFLHTPSLLHVVRVVYGVVLGNAVDDLLMFGTN